MKVFFKEKGLFFYGLCLSVVISIVAFLFLALEHLLADFIWDLVPIENSFRSIYVVLICILGGLIVGLSRQRWGDIPKTAHATVSELKEEKTVNYKLVFPHLFVALIVLIFGAGVGPEAALLSAVVYLSVWQSDKLRYFYFHKEEIKEFSLSQKIKHLFHPFAYLQRFDANRSIVENRQKEKLVLNIFFVINGLVSFVILMKSSHQPSFVTKMGQSQWQWQELWWIIPLLLFGVLYGYAYRWFAGICKQGFSFWNTFPLGKALIGSVAIMVIGIFLPDLLFSGQTAIKLVPEVSSQGTFWVLSALAIIKLIFLQICLRTGWIGGDIFPIVFSSVLQGFAVAQLLPQVDSLLIVAIISATITMTILKQPLFGLFVALFFPINLFPIFLILMGAFVATKQVMKRSRLKGN